MEKKYSDIDLARYFSGEASSEERRSIETWSHLSRENMELFTAARFVWERSKLSEESRFDTEKALSGIHKKLNLNAKSTQKTLYYKVAAIAAVILIPLLVIFLTKEKPQQLEVVYYEVSAGPELKYFKLADSSEVWLNKNSKLFVPDKFVGNEYKLRLEGEAFFRVSHKPVRVFIVETGSINVKVLGTAFNLKTLDSKRLSVLSVTEGKVLCSKVSSGAEKIVEKGSMAIVSEAQGAIIVDKLEDENFLAWKTKTLKFRETPFKEVVKTLGEYYQINFEISDSALLNLPVSTTLVNVSPGEVMKLLQMASDEIEIVKTEQGYQVHKKK